VLQTEWNVVAAVWPLYGVHMPCTKSVEFNQLTWYKWKDLS